MSIKDCKVIELPKITDPRGNLTFIEMASLKPYTVVKANTRLRS